MLLNTQSSLVEIPFIAARTKGERAWEGLAALASLKNILRMENKS